MAIIKKELQASEKQLPHSGSNPIGTAMIGARSTPPAQRQVSKRLTLKEY
ncbi:MAG TPA: hypothetical protein V6C91_11135 [Coleofasciculaceae cyanobacterium]